MRDRLLILVRWCRAALTLLVAVVEGLRGESLMTDNLTSERRFLPSMISTGSWNKTNMRSS